MDDDILIEKVHQNDELYNIAHRKYTHNHHKDIIWSKIVEELNTTGEACKTRWISLRDQLRKALKKKKTKRGQAANKQTKWKYEDCMSFIIPFFKERETHSLIGSPKSASEESNNEDISQQNNKTTDEDTLNENMKSEQEIISKCSRIIRSPSLKPKSTKNMSAAYYSKVKKMSKPENASSVLKKYMLDRKNNESKISCVHPIDTFFNGLAATVKTFSPQYQHMAKNQLFNRTRVDTIAK